MAENDLVDLPEAMAELKQITSLNIGTNRFTRVPAVVSKLTSLTTLDMGHMMLTGEVVDMAQQNLAQCFYVIS